MPKRVPSRDEACLRLAAERQSATDRAPRGDTHVKAGLGLGWLVAICLFSAPVRAEAPPRVSASEAQQREIDAQVWTWLAAGVESHVPMTRFAELGEPGTKALIAIFEREDAPRYVRLRALSALAAVGSPSARAYLEALVRSAQTKSARLGALHPSRSPTVLRRALHGLSDGEVSFDAIEPCLKHKDPAVRAAAVRALSRGQTPKVKRALEAQLAVERSQAVKRALLEALTDRSAPPAAPPRAAPKTDSPPR